MNVRNVMERCDNCKYWRYPFYWEGTNPEPSRGTCDKILPHCHDKPIISKRFKCSEYESAINNSKR